MSGTVRNAKYSDLFTNKTTTGLSTVVQLARDENFEFDLYFTDNGAAQSATVKVRAALQEDADLTAAASATNRWAYVQFTSLIDQVTLVYAGDTGVTLTTAGVTMYNVDSFGYRALAVEITAINNAALHGGCYHNSNN